MTDDQLVLLLMCADRSKIVQYIRAGEFDDLADICGRRLAAATLRAVPPDDNSDLTEWLADRIV
jgi:hypothetical protein